MKIETMPKFERSSFDLIEREKSMHRLMQGIFSRLYILAVSCTQLLYCQDASLVNPFSQNPFRTWDLDRASPTERQNVNVDDEESQATVECVESRGNEGISMDFQSQP